ncbi:MAG: hypothetical protein ACD_54C00381G0001 [uncultured bacterium]|nr:MAG: hypothetical protein ACD_54C00381G0001 [uncultured bacterium]
MNIRQRCQQDQPGKGDQRTLPAKLPPQSVAQRKRQSAGKPRHQRHLGNRAARLGSQPPGQKGKTAFIKTTGLRHPDQRPDQAPDQRIGRKPQSRHAQRRQNRRIAQHCAAPAPIHPSPGKWRQRRHHQKAQRRPEGQLCHRPAGCRLQIRQQRREGVIHPGIGQGLAKRQQPDRPRLPRQGFHSRYRSPNFASR